MMTDGTTPFQVMSFSTIFLILLLSVYQVSFVGKIELIGVSSW
jgi:hypothetical protein